MLLKFRIHYQAPFGQTLVVVGAGPELGNWDVNKGIILEWSQVFIYNTHKQETVSLLNRAISGPKNLNFPPTLIKRPLNTNTSFASQKKIT